MMTSLEEVQTSFREVMATVCTPVSVVTAMAADRPHGTTVSAFASLSLAPPMALVSLDRDSDLLRYVRETGKFGLNVLGADQTRLATAFAGKGDSKFESVQWESHAGVPHIDGVPGWLACTVAQLVEGGDHILVLGNVIAADTVTSPPLTYHARAFGTHAAHREPVQ